jgi:hypothetical protein
MGRPIKNSDKEGGFFALWAKAWLEDEKLNSISKELKCCFVDVMACVQIVDWVNGKLEKTGFVITEEQLLKRANITSKQLKELLILELVQKDDRHAYFIPNWYKWQNPKAKYEKRTLKVRSSSSASSSTSERTAPKGAPKGNGFAGSGMTEDEFKNQYPDVYAGLKSKKA